MVVLRRATVSVSVLSLAMLTTVLLASAPAAAQGTAAEWRDPMYADARALSMAGAFVAVADDARAVFWNPAGLGVDCPRNAWFAYLSPFSISGYGFGALACDLGEFSGVSLGLGGSLESADLEEEGDPDEVVTNPIDLWQGAVAGAVGLGDSTWVGAAVRGLYLTGSIEGDAVTQYGVAADVGMLAELPGLRLGAVVKNLLRAGELGADLGMQVRVGAALYVLPNLLVAGDFGTLVSTSSEEPTEYGIGAEYSVTNFLKLRAGLGAHGSSFGVGLQTGSVNLDYAYLTHSELPVTHVISCGIRF